MVAPEILNPILRYNLVMRKIVPLEPVDYLVIGHISCDITPEGPRLGGTAAYAALTARALGLRVGVVTAWGGEVPLDRLDGIQVRSIPAQNSTTFENVYSPDGRKQFIHHLAPDIIYEDIPQGWRETNIIHIGPIAGEGKSLLEARFSSSLMGLTPQGWLRNWDGDGRVHIGTWPGALQVLPKVGAAVISIEDVGGDEDQVEAMAEKCRVLAVTEGASGARLYWNGDLRRFRALQVRESDPTGAGDIFAAAFFWRFSNTRDPWTAAKFATHLASYSVTRPGLEGIPTREEIQTCLVEVI
jgi:sugar/nucleoside kinase (ribokinase family)